jgi:hypothetical protein
MRLARPHNAHIVSAERKFRVEGRRSAALPVRADPGSPTKELAMVSHSMRFTLSGAAAITLAGLVSFPVAAAQAERAAMVGAPPVVIAQATRSAGTPTPVAVPNDAYPAYQRGVRQAAAESNEALRRYIWRTRMIYDFYYPDFASGD